MRRVPSVNVRFAAPDEVLTSTIEAALVKPVGDVSDRLDVVVLRNVIWPAGKMPSGSERVLVPSMMKLAGLVAVAVSMSVELESSGVPVIVPPLYLNVPLETVSGLFRASVPAACSNVPPETVVV